MIRPGNGNRLVTSSGWRQMRMSSTAGRPGHNGEGDRRNSTRSKSSGHPICGRSMSDPKPLLPSAPQRHHLEAAPPWELGPLLWEEKRHGRMDRRHHSLGRNLCWWRRHLCHHPFAAAYRGRTRLRSRSARSAASALSRTVSSHQKHASGVPRVPGTASAIGLGRPQGKVPQLVLQRTGRGHVLVTSSPRSLFWPPERAPVGCWKNANRR